MAIQTLDLLRLEAKYRFIDYLKASKSPYYEPALTVCPHCGQHAGIVSDYMWNCTSCGHRGDVIDYVKETHSFRSDAEAIKHVCRVLGIKICFLDTISADDLMDMQFPDSPELIEKVLGKGLYILAGAPKIGKSWLVLWIAHCVSVGAPVWELKTKKCDVLYLSLEDTYQRLQRRLVEVSGGETGSLTIATDAELLGGGLEEQLSSFLQEHPETKFIIIDTLQKIRQLSGDTYSYAGDYSTMAALKQIADRFGLTILLVHHTRKQKSSDAMEKISGTTGLMGCADGSLVLEKESRLGSQGSLTITSREHPDMKLLLDFDKDAKTWKFIGYAEVQEEEPEDPILAAISQFMKETENWKGTATQLLENLQKIDPEIFAKPNSLVRKLNAKSAELKHRYGLSCTNRREENIKYLIIKKLSDKTDMCDISETPLSA